MADFITKKQKISVIIQEVLYESKTWITKGRNRNLISEEDFDYFKKEINIIGKMLNKYIKSIGKTNDQ